MTDSPFISIIGVLIIFPLFWSAIVFLVSFLGGWRKLAGSYKCDTRLRDGVLKWKSGSFRFIMNYNFILHIKAIDKGLYLATNLFFRVGHPPLLIPWDRVIRAEISTVIFTFIKLQVASKYSDEDIVHVSLYGRGVGNMLMPYLESQRLLSAE